MKNFLYIFTVFFFILNSHVYAATWTLDYKGSWHFNGEPERSKNIVPSCRSRVNSVERAPSEFYYTYTTGQSPGPVKQMKATDKQAFAAMFSSCVTEQMSALMASTPRPDGSTLSKQETETMEARDLQGHGTLTLVPRETKQKSDPCSQLSLGGIIDRSGCGSGRASQPSSSRTSSTRVTNNSNQRSSNTLNKRNSVPQISLQNKSGL